MRRLALFLDGTWNKPEDNTNVWRLRSMLARQDAAGSEQVSYYDTGVGTGMFDRIRGGAGGMGLSENVRQAYEWLIQEFDDGDEVYVFGFSRGSYTARSLAGMIARCGLLQPGSPMSGEQLFQRYKADRTPIYRLPQTPAGLGPQHDMEDRWIVTYSRRVRIRFIGVWDTVGALGLPFFRDEAAKRGEFGSHAIRLSNLYDNVCHAMALDENRKDYRPSRFYYFFPAQNPTLVHTPPPVVEQRWFIGAHSNVGGGYRNNELAQIPLRWMQSNAIQAGLAFRATVPLTGQEHMAPVVDSFAKFAKGLYRVVKLGRRHWRTIGATGVPVSKGHLDSVNEHIDASVFARYQADPKYRPKNLVEWAAAEGVNLDTQTGDRTV